MVAAIGAFNWTGADGATTFHAENWGQEERMSRAERIEAAVRQALSPEAVEVIDESHLHAGHAGARPDGETHYRVRVVAAAFEGLSRVQRQRLINEAVKAEFDSGLHALALETRSPAEAS